VRGEEAVSGRGCRECCSADLRDLQSVRGEEAVSARGCRERYKGLTVYESRGGSERKESGEVHTRGTYRLREGRQ
jgi:hypothetical protein